MEVSKHVRWHTASASENSHDVQSLCEEIHNDAAFRVKGEPQWRVDIRLHLDSKSFLLAFACSHALTDGMSGYAFHRTFLEALRMGAVERREELPLPLEQAGDLKISWRYLLGPLVNEYAPEILARWLGVQKEKREDTWLGAEQRPVLEENLQVLKTAVLVKSVPAEKMGAVLAACRKHQARLTGLLDYLVAKALSQTLNSRGKDYATFETMTAIDLRRCVSSGRDHMANYVSVVNNTITVEQTDQADDLSTSEWAIAAQLTAHLVTASQSLTDQPVGLLKYLSNFKEWTLKNARAPADTSFEVSNLAVFDGGSESNGGWRVEDMAFSQSASMTGPALNINTAGANSGALNITATWLPKMLGVEDEMMFVEEVLDIVSHVLEKIGSCQ